MGRKINPVQLPQHPGTEETQLLAKYAILSHEFHLENCLNVLKTTNNYKTNRQTWHNDVRVNLLPGDQQIPVGVQQFGRKFLWHLVVLEEVLTASNPFGHFVTCNMIF